MVALPTIYWRIIADGGNPVGAWKHMGNPSGTIFINNDFIYGSDGCNRVCAAYRREGNRLVVESAWSTLMGCFPHEPSFSAKDLQFRSLAYTVDGDRLTLYAGWRSPIEFERDPDGEVDFSATCS
jgi:heat shock protein HslJ